jgi:hypothetical protein
LFPGKWNPAREGAGVPEGDLTWSSQIRDALPLERSCLDSTVVDPRRKLCYFNCVWSRQDNNKGPSNGVLMVGHFILFFYPDNVFWWFFFITE